MGMGRYEGACNGVSRRKSRVARRRESETLFVLSILLNERTIFSSATSLGEMILSRNSDNPIIRTGNCQNAGEPGRFSTFNLREPPVYMSEVAMMKERDGDDDYSVTGKMLPTTIGSNALSSSFHFSTFIHIFLPCNHRHFSCSRTRARSSVEGYEQSGCD